MDNNGNLVSEATEQAVEQFDSLLIQVRKDERNKKSTSDKQKLAVPAGSRWVKVEFIIINFN